MRKGYALIEVLMVIMVFAMLSVPVAYTTKVLTSGIPRSQKIIEVNSSMIDAMIKFGNDVSHASDISKDKNGNILLNYHNRQIKYILNDGFVEKTDGQSKQRWNIPKARFTFEITSDPAVVEVATYIEFKDEGKTEKKFANSYMFFANVLTMGDANGQTTQK